MRVLVACEESGIVRDAFSSRGHDAWSCDLLPRTGNHICDDVLLHLEDGWDLMIAHPPCTRLCNSGVRWLAERNLWSDLDAAVNLFLALLTAPIPKRAIENPIPHCYARERIGRYSQLIQPYEFGEPESKATCLWLRGLPPLMATIIETRREQRIWKLPKTPNRSQLRSRTYPGVAKAMFEQWG